MERSAVVIFQRARRFLQNAPGAASHLGWRWWAIDQFFRHVGPREVSLRPRGFPQVRCRLGTADVFEYITCLGQPKLLPIIPFYPQYIVDAGAHVGYTALWFQRMFPKARIIAIEPDANNAAMFRRNCPSIALEQAALWPSDERVSISNPESDVTGFQMRADQRGTIEAISVPSLMRRHNLPHIDIFKIDIEGAEKDLFHQPQDWINKVRLFMIESHEGFIPGCTDAIEGALTGFRYVGLTGEYRTYLSAYTPPRSTSTA